MIKKSRKIKAILGPTNTGKTYLAIRTMLSYQSGMIGFPLRLLAREIYDQLVEEIGFSFVALITGEEKIIPKNSYSSKYREKLFLVFFFSVHLLVYNRSPSTPRSD